MNVGEESLIAHTDPMRQIALFALETPDVIAVATDLRLLTQLPGWQPQLSQQAIYHHLNFGYIPTPFTIYEQIRKIPPGTRLIADPVRRSDRTLLASKLSCRSHRIMKMISLDQLREKLISVIGGHAESVEAIRPAS